MVAPIAFSVHPSPASPVAYFPLLPTILAPFADASARAAVTQGRLCPGMAPALLQAPLPVDQSSPGPQHLGRTTSVCPHTGSYCPNSGRRLHTLWWDEPRAECFQEAKLFKLFPLSLKGHLWDFQSHSMKSLGLILCQKER